MSIWITKCHLAKASLVATPQDGDLSTVQHILYTRNNGVTAVNSVAQEGRKGLPHNPTMSGQ